VYFLLRQIEKVFQELLEPPPKHHLTIVSPSLFNQNQKSTKLSYFFAFFYLTGVHSVGILIILIRTFKLNYAPLNP